MIAGIALVLVLLFIILIFISGPVRDSISDILGLKSSESSIGSTKCNNACDLAKQQVMNCGGPEWKNQYCLAKYNDSLSCFAAETQNVISACTHKTGEVDCSCV